MRFALIIILFVTCSFLSGNELHNFVRQGNLQTIESLLKAQPEIVNSYDSLGATALSIAASKGFTDIAKKLIESGADVNLTNSYGGLPIHLASFYGYPEIVRMLVEKGSELNLLNQYGYSALHLSISKNFDEITYYLLDKGADPFVKDDTYGGTAIHWASNKNNLELIKYLNNNGVSISLPDKDGSTPLLWAIFKKNHDALKLLVEKGANPDEKGPNGVTPMFTAVYNQDTLSIKLLADFGADINVKTNDGDYLLNAAVSSGNLDMVKLLIKYGANLDASSCKTDDPNCQGAFTSPVHAAAHSNPEMLNFVLNYYDDINTQDSNGFTPLMRSVWNENIEVMKIFLSRQAAVNAVQKDGKSALTYAIESGNTEKTRLLIEAGADCNLVDKRNNSTFLHLAAGSGYKDIVELLLEKDPDINAKDNLKRTPAYLAKYYGNKEITELLLAHKGKIKPKMKDEPLTADLINVKNGEAYINYLYHSGWVIFTEKHVLVFDYWNDGQPPAEKTMLNGWLTSAELKGRDVMVFISHEHEDHWNPDIFKWSSELENINYILGFNPENHRLMLERQNEIPAFSQMTGRMTNEINGVIITSFPSTDSGVGYLVEVDGITVLHPGDHANAEMSLSQAYKSEIDYIAEMNKKIDIAFFPVTGCGFPDIEAVKEGIYYSVDKLKLKSIYPMHVGNDVAKLGIFKQECAERIPGLEVNCFESKGDRFAYKKQKTEVR